MFLFFRYYYYYFVFIILLLWVFVYLLFYFYCFYANFYHSLLHPLEATIILSIFVCIFQVNIGINQAGFISIAIILIHSELFLYNQ